MPTKFSLILDYGLQIGKRLTEPHHAIADGPRRRTARLLLAAVATAGASNLIATLFFIVTRGIRAEVLATTAIAAMSAIVYILARTLLVDYAVDVLVGLAFVTSFSIIIAVPDAHTAVLAIIPFIAASIFYSARNSFFVLLLALVSLVIIGSVVPGDWRRLPHTLFFLSGTGLGIIISTAIRRHFQQTLSERNQQLATSQAYLRATINGSLSGFYLLKTVRNDARQIDDFALIDINPAAFRQAQLSLDTPYDEAIRRIHDSTLMRQIFPAVIETINSRRTSLAEIPQPNGKIFEFQIVPVADGVAVSALDITDRLRTVQQRNEISLNQERIKILHNFIADASHDLKTPLTVIKTSLYVAKNAPSAEKIKEALDQGERQVKRLQQMIEAMLNLSAVDNLMSEQLKRSAVNLNYFLYEIVESYQDLAMMSQRQLTLDAASNLPAVAIDSSQMRIALQNLIDNGLRYTPTDGAITVRAYPAEHAVVVEVEDSGEGIAESDLARIFDRFYRSEKHRPTTGGTGLGLAITKRIVELHGATIVAISPRGALFRIRIPVSSAS